MKQIKYIINQKNFMNIPGIPMAYWASANISNCFKKGLLIQNLFDVRKGADTGENGTFLRHWYEISKELFYCFNKNEDTWVSYAKGGEFHRWYGNNDYVILWQNNGYALKHSKANLRSQHMYFKRTITWSALSSGSSSFRANYAEGLFDSAGSSMMPLNNDYFYVLAVMNTKISDKIFDILNPTINYGAGTVGMFPLILNHIFKGVIEKYSKENVDLSKQDLDSFETSWDFKKHPLI